MSTELTRLARQLGKTLTDFANAEEAVTPPPPTPDPVPVPDPPPPDPTPTPDPDPTPPPPEPTPNPPPPGAEFLVPTNGTLAQAFASALAGQTKNIRLVQDITVDQPILLGKQTGAGLSGVTVNFNGATITDACDSSVGNYFAAVGAPGCHFVNYRVIGNYGHRRCLKVYPAATGFIVDGFYVSQFGYHCLDIDSDDSVVMNYEIHHILAFDPSQPENRADAHGIVTLRARNLFIGKGRIYLTSGDAFQGDRGDQWDNITIDGADWFGGQLDAPANGFPAGYDPMENAIDTKSGQSEKHLTVRNSKFHGFRSTVLLPNGLRGIGAALNFKEHVTFDVSNCEIYDSTVGLRASGVRDAKWTKIDFHNNQIHDCSVAVRGEDKLKDFTFTNNKLSACQSYFKKGSASSEPWSFQGWAVENNVIHDAAIVGHTWPVASGDKAAIGTAPMDFPIPPITHDGTSAVRNTTNVIQP